MAEIVGQPGELVDRMVELLNSDALGEDGWHDVCSCVAYLIGGTALDKAVPDTDREPVPGSVGERMRLTGDLVSRSEYLALIQRRLGELVRSGVDEAFLVESVRDAVRRFLEHMTDVGEADRNRAKMRERLERDATDPEKIRAFRALLARDDPTVVDESDEEIAERFRHMARSELLLPTSADAALKQWAMLTHWDQQAASYLPDPAFEEWRLRMLRRYR